MSGEIYIGLVSVVFSIGVLPISILYFLHRVHAKKLDSIVKVVELSGSADTELMKALNTSNASYKADYKYGLIWLALGVPLCVGILMESGFSEAIFGSIPVFVGIAYLISGKLRLREAD